MPAIPMNEQSFPKSRRAAGDSASGNKKAPPEAANAGGDVGASNDQPSSDGARDVWAGVGAGASNGGGGRSGNDQRLSVPPPERSQQVVERREQPLETFTPSSAYMGPEPEEAGLDLRKYVWLLFKHRWLVLGSAGVFICLGLLATFLTTPVYQASTTIQINRDTPDPPAYRMDRTFR